MVVGAFRLRKHPPIELPSCGVGAGHRSGVGPPRASSALLQLELLAALRESLNPYLPGEACAQFKDLRFHRAFDAQVCEFGGFLMFQLFSQRNTVSLGWRSCLC